MYRMIKRQPKAIQYVIENCSKDASEAAELLKDKRVYLTGCGSSFHAALYGEYVLRANGFDAFAVYALDMLHYTPDLRNSTSIILSHSWKTQTTLKALETIRKETKCVGITANENANSDILILTGKEFDESDCVTLGYTTELAALALMAEVNTGRLPELVRSVLRGERNVKELVETYSSKKRYFILGAGPNTATAYEMALKMKEGNFTDTEAMQLEQMLHGSLSGVDRSDVVFIVASETDRILARTIETARALKEIGSVTIAVTDSNELADSCMHSIKVPRSNMFLNPIVSIIPLQLFAYHLAVANGINPDLTREDDPRYRRAYGMVHLHFK
jgi:glucosamine--fructose-6-phosphate aminotransferase (isomerizing)